MRSISTSAREFDSRHRHIDTMLELSFVSPLHTLPVPFAKWSSSDLKFAVAEYEHTVIAIPMGLDRKNDVFTDRKSVV